MVEFDMNVQEAAEAPNINSFQMRSSFGYHENRPGDLLLHDSTPSFIRKELRKKGYKLQFRSKTSGPINAIFFDNIKKLLDPLIPRYAEEGKSYLTIAFGCTGGKHRLVFVAEKFVHWLKKSDYILSTRHRDLTIN